MGQSSVEAKEKKKDVGSLMYKVTSSVLGDPQLMVTGHFSETNQGSVREQESPNQGEVIAINRV